MLDYEREGLVVGIGVFCVVLLIVALAVVVAWVVTA